MSKLINGKTGFLVVCGVVGAAFYSLLSDFVAVIFSSDSIATVVGVVGVGSLVLYVGFIGSCALVEYAFKQSGGVKS
jgi:hypothetical protein